MKKTNFKIKLQIEKKFFFNFKSENLIIHRMNIKLKNYEKKSK
jgi:hypothetical protein